MTCLSVRLDDQERVQGLRSRLILLHDSYFLAKEKVR